MRVWVLMVFGWGAPAAAAPVLDYEASEDCWDAGRFADEVSARIGSQAFGEDEPRMVIRIARSGAETIGTLELGEGTRLVRSATCPEVFDGLVMAAATLLYVRPAAPPVAAIADPEPPSGRVCAFRNRSWFGSAIRVGIREDTALITSLKPGRFHCWTTSAGVHTYTAKTEVEKAWDITVPADGEVYLRGRVQMGWLVGRPDLLLSTKDEMERPNRPYLAAN